MVCSKFEECICIIIGNNLSSMVVIDVVNSEKIHNYLLEKASPSQFIG